MGDISQAGNTRKYCTIKHSKSAKHWEIPYKVVFSRKKVLELRKNVQSLLLKGLENDIPQAVFQTNNIIIWYLPKFKMVAEILKIKNFSVVIKK